MKQQAKERAYNHGESLCTNNNKQKEGARKTVNNGITEWKTEEIETKKIQSDQNRILQRGKGAFLTPQRAVTHHHSNIQKHT